MIVQTKDENKAPVDAKVHVPVLLQEVLQLLDPKPGQFFVDGTFGQGGHSEKILERIGPKGKLLVVDWDWNALKFVSHAKNVIPVNDNFACLHDIIKSLSLEKADGLILDLGLSSVQLETSGRGFTFRKDEPLLMTYDPARYPVKDVIRDLSEGELADAIQRLSGEKYALSIAKTIKTYEKKHPIQTSRELAEIVRGAVLHGYERGRIHPATRTFMAFRILANRELENLEKILMNLQKIVKPGGRVAIISFHSLEDRMVKHYFQKYAQEGTVELINKKPIIAGREEIQRNPRARSAKLRGAIIK